MHRRDFRPGRFADFDEYSPFVLKFFAISSGFEGTGGTLSGQLVYQGFSLQPSLVMHSYIERLSIVGWSTGSIIN